MFLLLSALLAATPLSLAEEPSREYVLKAAYVYRITQFVAWPAEEGIVREETPPGVCILGEDPFGQTIDYIEEKQSRGRRFSLFRLETLDSSKNCRVLFISASEKGSLDEILSDLDGRGTLTISDLKGFARAGGMIGLVVNRQGKVDLEVNLAAAEKAGIQISAKLLELSRIIEDKGRG
ncbi:MAG: YfiR family protein [bacterium]|nr:YfiR family protein [bacterium]